VERSQSPCQKVLRKNGTLIRSSLWRRARTFLVATVGIVTAVFQFGLPWWMREGDRNHVYESEAGALRYQVHLPPQHDGTTQLPVIMAIHGCGMTGYGWNSMKATTQFNSLADREGFIVVYPTQRMFRSLVNCWNSSDPREQHRHSGEPALLAGVARQVVEAYNADPAQVHVTGASSGAGAAVILAATYPDVFATVASVAGGEYGLNQVDPNDPDSTLPDYTARQAWSQMGDRARQVPLLVIQGEEDAVVPPLVATRLVAHWTAVSDFVEPEPHRRDDQGAFRTGQACLHAHHHHATKRYVARRVVPRSGYGTRLARPDWRRRLHRSRWSRCQCPDLGVRQAPSSSMVEMTDSVLDRDSEIVMHLVSCTPAHMTRANRYSRTTCNAWRVNQKRQVCSRSPSSHSDRAKPCSPLRWGSLLGIPLHADRATTRF
jgi:poly(hydroxyalkanoate) depolymerase family esterase